VRAYPTYLLLRGLGSVAGGCALTYSLVYQVQKVGLSPFQLVLVGTVLELTYLVAQLPTGLLADRLGRKPAVVTGLLLLGAGFAVQSLVPTPAAVLAGTAVYAVGSAAGDGAEQAWVAGELGDDRAAAAFSRGSQVAQVGTVLGIGAGALLGLPLALVAGGVAWLGLAALLAVVMRERGFVPAGRAPGSRVARVRPSAALLAVLAAVFVLGLGSEGWDRLGPARLLSYPGVGVPLFGLLGVLSLLGAAGLTELLRRRLTPDRAARLLLLVEAGRVAAGLVFVLGGPLPLVAAAWLVAGLLRSAAAPLLDTWLVAVTDPATRATALSAAGQADSAGQLVGGPPVGWLGSVASVRTALLVAVLVAAPALPLLARARGRVESRA
jgi:DHA3 family tetracycline resistance protein-like MFS transporter